MTRLVAFLGLSLLVCCAAPLRAQESAQDLFLKIYLLIQDADKLENAGQKSSARERYNVSLARLDDLKNNHPQWEPTIVNFRLKYCQEKVKALEGLADDNPGQVVAPIDPSLLAAIPPAPPVIRNAPPPVETTPAPPETAVASTAPAPTAPPSNQDYVARRAPTIFEMEGTTPPASYNTPSTTAAPSVESPSATSPTVTYTPPPSLSPAMEAPSSYTTTPSTAPAAAPELPGDPALLKDRIRDLEGQLASTKDRLDRATTEAAQLRTRTAELEQQLKTARESSGEQQVTTLMQENQRLKQQLATAEQTIANIQLGGGGEQSVLKLQEQIDKLQDQLELARQENNALRQTNEEYRQKLEGLQLKLDTTVADDSLRQENTMLKDIIRRQVKEQTRREVAKRMAYEELSTMAVDSQRLKTQLDILGSPLVELTEEERALLREPAATLVSESSSASASATSPSSVPASASLSAPLEAAGSQALDYSTRPRVPAEFRETAEEANRLFKQGSFDEAAAQYMTILNTYPESLYALSNLAVVRFQQGNYPEAEQYLSRAIKLAPQDAFSHSILGIALYQQGKYDEAVQILSRATALDPNDPKTRNYLGIAASQKGWQEAAEQECRKAIEIDPQYGDAHFNLAVIYATQKPPARELSRRHYNRALELGVPRDQQLETLIR